MAEHCRTFAQYSRMIAEHTRLVAEHPRRLAEYSRMQTKHQRMGCNECSVNFSLSSEERAGVRMVVERLRKFGLDARPHLNPLPQERTCVCTPRFHGRPSGQSRRSFCH
jgi:hypothetical protein